MSSSSSECDVEETAASAAVAEAEAFMEEYMCQYMEDDSIHQHVLRAIASNTPHTRRYVQRDREGAHERLMRDYFDDNPTWGPNVFRRHFRMRKELFTRLVNALEAHNTWFQQRPDATGKKGFTPLQKCTNAIRQLAYGGPADHYDEYLRVSDTIGYECLRHFSRGVIEVFGGHYLRRPTVDDYQRLMEMHKQRDGFPGMLGSLDCMHWTWKNSPVAWKGQFTRGDHGVPTIMLEAVAYQDLWIWHAFFGVAGSNNDINVLNQSPLFNDVLQGQAPSISFKVNGTQYAHGYYLTYGIYPEWTTLVKSFQHPQDPKRRKFKKMQEAAMKDVERAFGVLQARWEMIRGPSRLWYKENITDIMYACIILHNMIIEDEGEMASQWVEDEPSTSSNNIAGEINRGSVGGFNEYLRRGARVRDKTIHHQLRSDLVEHVWARFGDD
ncbi:protein ALP1-like [Salvia miltiorrhiza]|uniref:protein ALP1-like n=1 Tax=Salvia miltiorrhiza TaxID=226208 RepID=UPI0025ACB02F|nr:protein ALP1-like [Salvia miltiorrhiza]